MRNVIVILTLVLALISCQSANNSFSINGSIGGIEKGKVYLQKIVDGKPVNIDSTDVVSGKFTFKGKMDMPDLRLLRLNSRDYLAQFFLDNANVIVIANKDSLRSTKIKGSPTQDIFQIYINEMEKLN